MKFFTFILITLCATGIYAQELNTSKPTKLTGISNPTTPDIKPPLLSPPKQTDALNIPKSNTSSPLPTEDKPINLSGQNGFVNPNEKYLTKLNKRTGGFENDPAMKRNQDYGQITTKASNVYILFRDFGAIDGDQIKLSVNMTPLISQATLSGNYQVYNLALVKGFNKIDFLALNQGTEGPEYCRVQNYRIR
ncbi:hypothetical protein [Flavobacterium sp. 3HN19-14]|uniref:hypothetical protein n=1 Tax=Flavobacterium sp. 3HN19-14 TaxID=3448133 RepID=UPI003EE0CA20